MGTRNLTIVKSQNKTKVAQYGQWDGYPTGQGHTIAQFIKTLDSHERLEEFRNKVNTLEEWTQKDMDEVLVACGGDPDSEWITGDVADKRKAMHPELSRDTGARVLYFISDGTTKKVILQEDFKNDTVFCEYYYTIDLDKQTVSVNGGKEYSFVEWTEDLMEQLENNED